MKKFISVLVLSLFTCGIALSLSQSTNSKDAPKPKLEATVDDVTKAAIVKYFNEIKTKNGNNKSSHKGKKSKSKALPPGLAKKKALPPGLTKQLERNGRLPPGLEKRELPADLRQRLSPPKDGTERVIIGDDIVLIEHRTQIILDILSDIIIN